MNTGFIFGIITMGIMLCIPYLIASLGEMFNQKAGIYNLGVEGIMMLGAFVAFLGELKTGSSIVGFAAAIIVGGLFGLFYGYLTINLQVIQGIAGIGLHLLGWGIASTLFRVLVGSITSIKGLEPLNIPVLSNIPILGDLLFNYNIMVYIGFLMVPLTWYVLYKTPWGLRVRAVGTKPRAADTLGVNVEKTRYQCVVLGGMMAGLGGAYLTICQTQIFADNITAGRGFIAVALVYFGKWKPKGIMFGALLFSLAHAFQRSIQVYGIKFPYELAVIIPYVLVIVVLAFSSKTKHLAPEDLGNPYDRESRV